MSTDKRPTAEERAKACFLCEGCADYGVADDCKACAIEREPWKAQISAVQSAIEAAEKAVFETGYGAGYRDGSACEDYDVDAALKRFTEGR